MPQSLCFNDFTFSPIIRNNQPWFRAAELAHALGYANDNYVTRLYHRNEDEFSCDMTQLIENSAEIQFGSEGRARIFSLRGCHLLAMFARTPVAKAFRKWVLDVIEKYGERVPAEQHAFIPTPSTPADRKPLRSLVNAWAKLANVHQSTLWPQVRAHFQLERINDLPVEWLPDALAWVQGKIDELNQKPTTATPALPAPPQPTREEQITAALERFRIFQREFFRLGSELEDQLRTPYWKPRNEMPDHLKTFAHGMNYGIQSLFIATCHNMEAMERYFVAHIAGEELMRRCAR